MSSGVEQGCVEWCWGGMAVVEMKSKWWMKSVREAAHGSEEALERTKPKERWRQSPDNAPIDIIESKARGDESTPGRRLNKKLPMAKQSCNRNKVKQSNIFRTGQEPSISDNSL